MMLLLSCNLSDSEPGPGQGQASPARLVEVTDYTAEELVGKYVAAIGGLEKWRAIESVRMTGKFTRPKIQSVPITIEKKRPVRMLRRIEDRQVVLQGIDGDAAWEIFPPLGITTAAPMNPGKAEFFRHWATVDSPLVDYQVKGLKVELLGKDPTGPREAYVLKVTFPDGGSALCYLDAQSHLLVKAVEPTTLGGGSSDAETVWSDYRESGGVLWPHSETTTVKSMDLPQSTSWEEIVVNPPLDDAAFKMPKS